jgi:hypothetical protein
MSSPSLGSPRSDSILFGAAWRANRIAEDLGADRAASGQGLSTRTVHCPDRYLHRHHHHHRYPVAGRVNQDRHGGYRTAFRTLPSIALSLIGAITAAKRIQWIHRASSNRLVLALTGASYWHAEIGIRIGPIAIAILWQTTIRIVVAAVWQHCRLHHHRPQSIIGVCICSSWPGFDSLSSPLDGMGLVIVAVLSPSATNLATVAGAATLVGSEQPREKSSILPRRDVCR